jgi:hypothetical protein
MQELRLYISLHQRGMPIVILEELRIPIPVHKLPVKIILEIENGTLIRHSMDMRYRPLILRLADQDTTRIGIQRMTEYIEKEIPFSHKTDRKTVAILRFGSLAIHTPALEIQYLIEVGSVECMDISIYG